jgi:hypothetical protein
MNKNITIITGLWDIGRGQLDGWSKRDFNSYKEKFFELLKTDNQLCIFIDESLKHEVEEIRKNKPTRIYIKNLTDFNTWTPHFNLIQEIRNNDGWRNIASWLSESPQANLTYYNPIVMTKFFMLNDVALDNPFNSEYFFWIDGGITNTVHPGYFTHDKVFDKLDTFLEKDFLLISYPYIGSEEIHGFKRKPMADYCNTDYVKYVCRGGFFGGKKDYIHQLNTQYYSIMENTLQNGYMGTEECFLTILSHTNDIQLHSVEDNGLIWPFFEYIKNHKPKEDEVALYVITFNSPNQFKTLIKSMLEYDDDFITKPKKYLLDNSTDLSTTKEYIKLCKKYNFTHIKKDNIGICGGRQFIAEHFDKSNHKYMYFFEDDMFFYPKKGELCKNGFNRYVEKLYNKSLEIIKKENFDYLKLNFTEFFGNNATQWAWYNISQQTREKYFPEKPNLPKVGYDQDPPKTNFKNIKIHKQIPYITGEIYYSNWPQIVSKEGNVKMFLTTKFQYVFEQTLMAFMFEEQKNNKLNFGLLLITPTEHDRFEHYKPELRKEN